MIKGTIRLRLSNPHRGDIGKELLSGMLSQAGMAGIDTIFLLPTGD
jgi:hypothetical protein